MINLESATNKIINRLCDYLSHCRCPMLSEPHLPLTLSGLLHHSHNTREIAVNYKCALQLILASEY